MKKEKVAIGGFEPPPLAYEANNLNQANPYCFFKGHMRVELMIISLQGKRLTTWPMTRNKKERKKESYLNLFNILDLFQKHHKHLHYLHDGLMTMFLIDIYHNHLYKSYIFPSYIDHFHNMNNLLYFLMVSFKARISF